MIEDSLSYPVILRPSDVKFTCKSIPTKFDNGNKLSDVLEEMAKGNILPKDIPPIEVVWFCDRWEWYTLNNRRLWLFQQLENREEIKYASMNRIEVMNVRFTYPVNLYSEVVLFDPPWDIKTNCILGNMPAHSLNSRECSPSRSGDEGSMFSILSQSLPPTRRCRTSSSGTTVAEDVDDFGEDSVEMNDENINVEVKMEFSPVKRSRSRTRRSRSPLKESRTFKRNYRTSSTRSNNHFSANKNKSPTRSNSFNRSRSVGPTKKSRSPLKRSYSFNRSKSLGPTKKICSPLKRSNSFIRSRSVGRNDQSNSLTNIPVQGNNSLFKYNSLYTENLRFRNRTRSKSVMSMRSECKESLSNWSSRDRKRSSSICSHLSRRSDSDVWSFDSRRRSSSVCSHRSIRSTASAVNYQLDKFSHERAPRYQKPRRNKYIENDFTSDYKYSTSRAMVKGNMDTDSISSGYGSGPLIIKSGISLSQLYTLWTSRRAEFLQARRSGQLHLMYGPEEGYLCGLCFKKFRQVVDLQQHSEELLHYACITCGRFFNTYTALGQHCTALYHTKD